MGGKSSRHAILRNSSRNNPNRRDSSTFNPYPAAQPRRNNAESLKSKYAKITDDYSTLEQVTEALAQAGLESSNLIVGVDFTKSNEWSGKLSFSRLCLHDLDHSPNPYEQAISIIGRTLYKFDEDNLIPCFGFGDASTHDNDVFSFYADKRPCNGFEEALSRYRELAPSVNLAGPTSFAPIIETAIGIVDESGGQYHVLLIIADGQVTRSIDTPGDQYSAQELETVNAIIKASQYPLSIVLVGVGDGPWDMMHQYDDNIPARAFDNFQFVNFTEIMASSVSTATKEAQFALAALMEIPAQYKATLDLQLLGNRRGNSRKASLPPPIGNRSPASLHPYRSPVRTAGINSDNQACPVCMTPRRDIAFTCGHQFCNDCAEYLEYCPVCGKMIEMKIRLR